MNLPHTISVHTGRTGSHLQGIARDPLLQHLYLSFTTCLLKTDLTGRILCRVDGIAGHLGCIAWNAEERRIYGSLEYKRDAIGQGILRNLGQDGAAEDGFYMARFAADKMDRPQMDALHDGVMDAVYLQEVYNDYTAPNHRYGCSGIDGCTFTDEKTLYVAYGIYSDTQRCDNDRQVLLQYDVSGWDACARPLDQNAMHRSGPAAPDGKHFLHTGNTTYGIQNLEYDASLSAMVAAVYPGRKPEFPNYDLFFIDSDTLTLTDFAGHSDHRFCGSHFPYGTEGLCALGDGYFYIGRDVKQGDEHSALVELYRFDTEELTFIKV